MKKKYNFRIAQLECSDKKMSNIFYWVKKKTCLGVLDKRRYVTKTIKQV